jgi:predicted aspartyl protease
MDRSHTVVEDRTMEPEPVGRVFTEARIENLKDLWEVERGLRTPAQARSVTVTDALVDTGATLLSLPTSLIQRLGLETFTSKQVRSSRGISEAALYEAVRLTIGGRSCTMDVLEVPDDVPVLIGQLPLEHLDYVVDLRSRTLIGNPAHGGEHVYELY